MKKLLETYNLMSIYDTWIYILQNLFGYKVALRNELSTFFITIIASLNIP